MMAGTGGSKLELGDRFHSCGEAGVALSEPTSELGWRPVVQRSVRRHFVVVDPMRLDAAATLGWPGGAAIARAAGWRAGPRVLDRFLADPAHCRTDRAPVQRVLGRGLEGGLQLRAHLVFVDETGLMFMSRGWGARRPNSARTRACGCRNSFALKEPGLPKPPRSRFNPVHATVANDANSHPCSALGAPTQRGARPA